MQNNKGKGMNGLDSPEKKKKRIEEEKTKREKSGKEVK
jgi:hypothetical protein